MADLSDTEGAAEALVGLYGAAVVGGPAAVKNYEYGDFFDFNSADEVRTKKQLASWIGVRYGNCNQKQCFAEPFASTPAYTVEAITAAKNTYAEKLVESALLPAGAPMPMLEAASTMACTVSGCLIRWRPLVAVNRGYVEACRAKYVQSGKWDCSIERRAVLSGDDPAYMHLTVTGSSTALALIAQVVYEYKPGQVRLTSAPSIWL